MNTYRIFRRFGWLSLVGLTLSCSDHPTVFRDNDVRAMLVADGVRVFNDSDQPLGVAAFNMNSLALLDWMMCADTGPDCLRLPPRGSITIPIGLDDGTGDVAVYAWAVMATPAGLRATSVANITIKR